MTSPPYFRLRDYGVDGQIGVESTPAEFVAVLVEVFREVRRVLADDGTLWLNLGDSYCRVRDKKRRATTPGVKSKDLIGIPWAVAFALRDDGWYLRSDIVWAKPSPMPESVTDRPTKSHEYIFLLSKSPTYFYDADAIREPQASIGERHEGKSGYRDGHPSKKGRTANTRSLHPMGANKRDVWTVATQPYAGAHHATYPPKLIEPCILAGSRVGDIVLDPFFGSGTTGMVAEKHGRRWIGIDLNPKYAIVAAGRTAQRTLTLKVSE